MTTIYFDHIIILVGLYQAHFSAFQQLNQPILICLIIRVVLNIVNEYSYGLFDNVTKSMLLHALTFSLNNFKVKLKIMTFLTKFYFIFYTCQTFIDQTYSQGRGNGYMPNFVGLGEIFYLFGTGRILSGFPLVEKTNVALKL